MRELALFAGAGGGILGGKLLGWRTVCAVECDAYAASVLVARQNDGCLAPFPIWDDVRTFDGRPWKGIVDVISGGFPCQDISAAGKGAGITGERSGLWKEFARIIREIRPRHVFVENSPMLTSRGLGVVLGDLAALGFDARWDVLGAIDVGAPHERERIWITAHADRSGIREREQREAQRRHFVCAPEETEPKHNGTQESLADTGCARLERRWRAAQFLGSAAGCEVGNADRVWQLQPQRRELNKRRRPGDPSWWTTEPDVGRMAHGVASRVDRIRAIGNGQVPAVARLAWELLK